MFAQLSSPTGLYTRTPFHSLGGYSRAAGSIQLNLNRRLNTAKCNAIRISTEVLLRANKEYLLAVGKLPQVKVSPNCICPITSLSSCKANTVLGQNIVLHYIILTLSRLTLQ